VQSILNAKEQELVDLRNKLEAMKLECGGTTANFSGGSE
jgi:hypothetical protein